MYYIGLDVHKKTISYCVKDVSGRIQQEGKVGSSRRELDVWMKTSAPTMECWYGGDDLQRLDLRPSAAACRADQGGSPVDAACDCSSQEEQTNASRSLTVCAAIFCLQSHMKPQEIRDRRRTLRYRHLLVRQMVQMKNRVSGLLMETGATGCTR